tara:strand:- start:544 stop:1383 length:840 start_codon:yes stop_codon:yes gene_type:complete
MFPADVSTKNLQKLMHYIRSDNLFIGSAITAPYKEKILKYINVISPEAKVIGSINTVKKINNELEGHNTDYHGAIKSLMTFKKKKNILILGCGGAGKAVILACIKNFNNAFFYLYNRDTKKLSKFIKKTKLKKYKIIDNKKILSLKNIDLTINSTSVGFNSWVFKNKKFYNLMFFTPFSSLNKICGIRTRNKKEFFKKNQDYINQDKLNYLKFLEKNSNCEFFDIIYHPLMTKFLKLAKINGHKILNGLQMNLDQAVKAFSIVNNKKIKKINTWMKTNG